MADARMILIADGNSKTVPVMTNALRELGCEAIAASDAHFVMTLALSHKVAAVVLGSTTGRVPEAPADTASSRPWRSIMSASELRCWSLRDGRVGVTRLAG